MRIIRAKFVNFVHLGDIEFTSDDEIIAFLGKNGSGKSTLLFALNPDPSSDRYITTYPAIKGLHAYKELVYSDGHKQFIIKVEYVPKKDKHSAKCYFDLVDENGNRSELNPTGHVDFYKELVNKHLNFNNSVAEVSYIYLNNNGLVTATPKRRKEIAESTIDVKLLKNMQKNAIDGMKESKATKNALNDQLYRAANSIGSVEEAKKRISEIDIELDKELKNQERLSTDKINKELKLSEIKSDVNVSRKSIEYMFNTISKVNSKTDFHANTFSDIQKSIKEIEHAFEIEFMDHKTYKEKLESIERQANLRDTIEYTKEKMRNYILINKGIEENLSKYLNVDISDNIIKLINNIKKSIEVITSDLSVGQNIEEEIKQLEDSIENLNRFRIEYEMKERKSDDRLDLSSFSKLSESCNRCPLYNEIVVNREFLIKNKDKYDNSNNELYELKITLSELVIYYNAVKEIVETLSKFIKESKMKEMGLTDINTSAKNISNNPNINYAEFIIGISDDVKEYLDNKMGIDISKRLIELNPLEDIDLSEIETIKLMLKRKTESLNYVVGRKQSLLDVVQDFDSVTRYESDYINSSESELAEILYKIDNYSSIKNRFEFTINQLNREIKESSERFRELTNERAMLERGIKDYESVSDVLRKANKDFEFFSRSKELLLKRIPLSLLENNLKFMESVTNRILSENNINIQIRVDATSSEINIPYIVNDAEVEDIRLCSQGETCLLSLLLNACMVHITGYGIMYLDEIDANLDEINRKKFNNIIYSILNLLNIKQIFGISHNISSNISSAKKFGLGDISELNINEDEIEFIK